MHLIILYVYVKDDVKLLVSNMAKIKLKNNYIKNIKKNLYCIKYSITSLANT